jgi:hypothetical protein
MARRVLVPQTVLSLVLSLVWSVVGLAVGADRAVWVASTSAGFMTAGMGERKWRTGRSPTEGTIAIGSDGLTFDAGSRGSVKIPYAAITRLTYGREVGSPTRLGDTSVTIGGDVQVVKGLIIVPPWPGSTQFTNKPHYILTIIRQDQTGAAQSDVFELGGNLVRPIFDTLERRTEKQVEFLSVDACLTLKTAKDCRLGNPEQLRGLRRVHVDARNDAKHLANIVSEIENADLGLQVVARPEDAEILLRFHGQRFVEDKTIDCGRGEVTIGRHPDSVVVLQFTDRDTSVWGRSPSLNFGREFVKAYKKANTRWAASPAPATFCRSQEY